MLLRTLPHVGFSQGSALAGLPGSGARKLTHPNYIAVGDGGGAKREIDSMLGHIEFLIEKLPPKHAAQAPLWAILAEARLTSPKESNVAQDTGIREHQSWR
jgi:hypothetical protein